ncbi:MAG: hypothetical protein RLZZ81_821 [Pseudomonadota bacterium]
MQNDQAVKDEWQIIKPKEDTDINDESSFLGDCYGLRVYLKQSASSSDTIHIDVQKSLSSDNHYLMLIKNFSKNCYSYLTGSPLSLDYSKLLAMLTIAAQMPIESATSDTGPLTDGWAMAAKWNMHNNSTILKQLQQQYPECLKIILEPPVHITGKEGNIFEAFETEGITLSGVCNSDTGYNGEIEI